MAEALKELRKYELVIRARLAKAEEHYALAVELDFPEEAEIYGKAVENAKRDLAAHQEFLKSYGSASS